MNLQVCFNASEDSFPLPQRIRALYGPFGFPAPRDARRPYISSNFVMGLDGKISFRELKGQEGGRIVSRSKEDRWLMDFLRAHHDGLLLGASTLREERGPDGRGWDYGIHDEELRKYRRESLRLEKQKVFVLTGSGKIDFHYHLFDSSRVDPWIVTSANGEKRLRAGLKKQPKTEAINVISVGGSTQVDVATVARLLREKHGIRTLLCEGGPTLYGELLDKDLIDEDFRTVSLQVLGKSTRSSMERPTAYGDVSYTPETAPWFKLMSLHYAPPYHAFFRLRCEGPRTFPK